VTAVLWVAVALADDIVRIHGTLQHTGSGEAVVELIVQHETGPPLLAWEGRIATPGPFVLEVPARLGDVRVRAGLDAQEDGLGPTDPQVLLEEPLSIGGDDIYGLVLTLRRIDLADPPPSVQVEPPEQVTEGSDGAGVTDPGSTP
jgi:hypothetical protein